MRKAKVILYIVFFPFLVVPAQHSNADTSDYTIRVTYDGPVTLNEVEVLLYDVDRLCETLVEDPKEPPSDDTAWTTLVILPDAEGNIPERGLNVPQDVVLHYAVARGMPSHGEGGGRDYYATFGCQDRIPEVDPTSATVIEIDMHNLWPQVEGTYQITSEGDTLTKIPYQIRPLEKSIEEFIAKPGLGMLRLIALSSAGYQYWQKEPWASLFECRGKPWRSIGYCGEIVPTSLGQMAARILEENVEANLSGILGVDDASIRELLEPGEDVFENAESFTMTGNLDITQDPDSEGLLGDTNSTVFNRITWTWEENDRTVDLREESFIGGENIEASVVFHPDDPGRYSLDIAPFKLSLNYGELLIWVLEGVIFPEFIHKNIDSFEDLFSELVDCASLSSRLMCEGEFANDPSCRPTLAFAVPAIEPNCYELKKTAIEAIESWWLSLIPPEQEFFYRIGTPPYNPCRMSFPPRDNDSKIQALGGSALPDRCEWEGEVLVYPDDDAQPFYGEWWGERL